MVSLADTPQEYLVRCDGNRFWADWFGRNRMEIAKLRSGHVPTQMVISYVQQANAFTDHTD